MTASAAGSSSRKRRQTSNSRILKEYQRIYRQTLTLLYKNFLIFAKSPISLILRALVFPIAVAVIVSELKNIGKINEIRGDDWGIAQTPFLIKDLPDAMNNASKNKLVFVRNGIANDTFGPVVEGILGQPGTSEMQNLVVDNPNDLFDLCRQSTKGASDCFAAVIFNAANDTTVEYTIALDSEQLPQYGFGKYSTDDTKFSNRIVSLQWALESHIGGFPSVAKPSLQPYGGIPNYNSIQSYIPVPETGDYWLSLVGVFVAPVFILILLFWIRQIPSRIVFDSLVPILPAIIYCHCWKGRILPAAK